MKTVDKFILKTYLGPMILTFFIVMFVLILQFMWRYIDELVGKGLGTDVLLELMMYAGLSSIPLGLPLATLLAAIMTMGNLGENYELLALKSAGISLPRILRPLFILIFVISVGSYFIADKVVPYSYKQMFSLIFDIRQQEQTMEFKDGIFFNGFPDMSIRVEHNDPKTKLLTGVLIYDSRDISKMSTTVADSGYISMSEDKKFILVKLFNGENYEQERSYRWFDNGNLQHRIFDVQNLVISIAGFSFERTDMEMFSNNAQAKTTAQLTHDIDSLEKLRITDLQFTLYPIAKQNLFTKDTMFVHQNDSVNELRAAKHKVSILDTIPTLSLQKRQNLYDIALRSTTNFESQTGEDNTKKNLDNLYKHKAEWHKKLSLPVSIMIFFLIGAPLGAIIRKGGLGMPIVVSVLFFVIYYIISLSGEKMAKEGTWGALGGMWISTFILLPIAIYLTYKATNDSNLFDMDWYRAKFKIFIDFYNKNIWKRKKVS